jgi:putative addiction module CopG family antidote
MDVHLTPEQEKFIRHSVEAGRFSTADEALQEAVSLLEAREQSIAELRADLDDGLADLDNGRYFGYTDETLPRMMDDIRREGRELHAQSHKNK